MGTVDAISASPDQTGLAGLNDLVGLSGMADSIGSGTDEALREFMLTSLRLTRETIEGFMGSMTGAERSRATQVKNQVDDYIEQLEKSKKLSGLQWLFKILTVIGVALSILAAVAAPTPMTIALMVAALALMAEPMISKAAGKESLVDQAFSAIMQKMAEVVGDKAAVAIMVAMMIAVSVVVANLGAKGISAVGNGALKNFSNTLTQKLDDFFQKIKEVFAKLINQISSKPANAATGATAGAADDVARSAGNSTSAANALKSGDDTLDAAGDSAKKAAANKADDAASKADKASDAADAADAAENSSSYQAFERFVDYAQSAILIASGGVQVSMGVLQREVAVMMADFKVDDALIEQTTSIIQMMSAESSHHMEFLDQLNKMLPSLFDGIKN